MKKLIRHFLINAAALWFTSHILPAFLYQGGLHTLLVGSALFMAINFLVVPLIKISLLPLNLLTLGIFAWVANVVGLYLLTIILPQFRILPYDFAGTSFNGFIIPSFSFNIVEVAIIASFLIGLTGHLLKWLLE